MLRHPISFTLAASLVAALFFGSTAAAEGKSVMVHVGHNKLDPAEVTISTGDRIIFHNMAAMPGGHTIVKTDGELTSGPLEMNDIWKHTFEEAGSYEFYIEQHPDAKTTITVE